MISEAVKSGMKTLKSAFITDWLSEFIFSSILWIFIFILSGIFYWKKPESTSWIGITNFLLFLFYHGFKREWRTCREGIEEDERQREEIREEVKQLCYQLTVKNQGSKAEALNHKKPQI